MLTALPQRWAHALFAPFVRRLLRGGFAGAHFLAEPPLLPTDAAVVLTPNHASWWDGFFAYHLNRTLWKREFHVFMREDQLKRFPFFRRIGAWGFRPDSPADVRATLRAVGRLTARPDSLVVFFPQGTIVPDVAPVAFKRGLSLLKPEGKTVLLPMYTRTEPMNRQKPTLFVQPGKPMPWSDYVREPSRLEVVVNELRTEALDRLLNQAYGRLWFGQAQDRIR